MANLYWKKNDELNELEKKTKAAKKEQKERYKELLTFMGVNGIDDHNSSEGKIKYQKVYKRKGYSDKMLLDLLKAYHTEDNDIAENCFKFYKTNIPKIEKEQLKITRSKKL